MNYFFYFTCYFLFFNDVDGGDGYDHLMIVDYGIVRPVVHIDVVVG